jgi:hypothetical protein
MMLTVYIARYNDGSVAGHNAPVPMSSEQPESDALLSARVFLERTDAERHARIIAHNLPFKIESFDVVLSEH